MARGAWKGNPKAIASFKARARAIPKAAARSATKSLTQNGTEAVSIIKGDAPGSIANSVGWNFGDPDTGGFKGAPKSNVPDNLRISIYAGGTKAPHAHLVHFGTAKRQTKSGRNTGAVETPQPFFWPNIRSLRRRHKARISRGANKAIKRVAARGGK